jgi:hypothetical protein
MKLESEMKLEDVIHFFVGSSTEDINAGFFVSRSMRQQIMIQKQNTIIRKATVRQFQWENIGGGVYRIFLTCE